jgi:hypothetical protein
MEIGKIFGRLIGNKNKVNNTGSRAYDEKLRRMVIEAARISDPLDSLNPSEREQYDFLERMRASKSTPVTPTYQPRIVKPVQG